MRYRGIGIALAIIHSLTACSHHKQSTAQQTQSAYRHPVSYEAEFYNLPAEQRKALRDLFLTEFYKLSITPIPKGYSLDEHNIEIWKKARRHHLLPDNDTDDWRGFFIVYNYGMWTDIFRQLKNYPDYLSGKGIIALCHYATVLQFSNDCKPTSFFFTDERLQELGIQHHPSQYSAFGIYSSH